MSKPKQTQIPVIIDEQNEVIPDLPYRYKLVRTNDGLTKRGLIVKYIEWEGGIGSKAKNLHDDIALEKSLVLDPGRYYTWMTTSITEIIEQKENYVKFKTTNSTYELFKIN